MKGNTMVEQSAGKIVGDVAAYGVVAGTLLELLPSIAAGFSIVWFAMMMIEKVVGKPLAVIIKEVVAGFRK